MIGTRPESINSSPWLDLAQRADRSMVRQALAADAPGVRELAILLSPAASAELETMARRAQALTRRHFGRTISLYAPLYLSDHCSSSCTYCGFSITRDIPRNKLSVQQMETEFAALKEMGIEEILLLTGDRLATAGFELIRNAVARAATLFHNVTVEVFSMTEDEYHALALAGCSGMTMFQETYDPAVYARLHLRGPKSNYDWRLQAPARALAGGIRVAGLGALLGLAEPRAEMISLFRHATELQRTFWRGGVSICFPRIRPQTGGFAPAFEVSERMLAQIIFAFRICLPDTALALSTRESPRFRDGVAGIGISKMSVASKTTVGGYSPETEQSAAQFEVNDSRGVEEFCAMLRGKGLEPVFKNWDGVYREALAAHAG
jgi:2-iminoacetate synthase